MPPKEVKRILNFEEDGKQQPEKKKTKSEAGSSSAAIPAPLRSQPAPLQPNNSTSVHIGGQPESVSAPETGGQVSEIDSSLAGSEIFHLESYMLKQQELLNKMREKKKEIQSEMQQSQCLFKESAGLIRAGASQTRFTKTANHRLQNAINAGSQIVHSNAGDIAQDFGPFDITEQAAPDGPEQAHHAGSHHHQDFHTYQARNQCHAFPITSRGRGNLSRVVGRGRQLSALGGGMIANPNPFSSSGLNTNNHGTIAALNNPNVSKGYCSGCRYSFYCPRCASQI